MVQRTGERTLKFQNKPILFSHAAAVGKKEGEGPLGNEFDFVTEDDKLNEKSWELAESHLQRNAIDIAIKKGKLQKSDLDFVLAGDLLNQCVASSIASVNAEVPYLGLYGACSTMALSLALGSCLIESEAAQRLIAAASSHYCSAERQFRLPLAYGGQGTPTAQWTATAAGAAVLSRKGSGNIRVSHAIFGKIVDMGVKDASNMGAAMAPSAYDTLSTLFQDLDAKPSDFDCIVTGDLGKVGADILVTLFERDGVQILPMYNDCGKMLFDESQDTHAGASGCGCSAAVLCGPLLRRMEKGEIKRLIFAGTGALMSPISVQQGQPISGICHAVVLERSE